MRRIALALVLGGCAPQFATTLDEGTEGESGSASGSTSRSTSTTSGSTTTTGSTGPAGTTTSGATSSGTTSSGSSGTGDPCDPGTHGCECFDGECVRGLVCGEGDLCYEVGECQGVDGTEGCPCAAWECFGDLQCWRGECVASCTDDPDNDDDHCGGVCGNACPSAVVSGTEYGGCEEGTCQKFASNCFVLTEDPVPCSDICAQQGASCGVNCGTSEWEAAYYDTVDCSDPPGLLTFENSCVSPSGSGSARCCCEPL